MENIVQLESHMSHFLVLSKKKIGSIPTWTAQEVSEWLLTLGLDSKQSKIALYQGVTGEMLHKAFKEEQFFQLFIDNFGIYDCNLL